MKCEPLLSNFDGNDQLKHENMSIKYFFDNVKNQLKITKYLMKLMKIRETIIDI